MASRPPTEPCVPVWYTAPPLFTPLQTCGSKNKRTGIQPSQAFGLRGLDAIRQYPFLELARIPAFLLEIPSFSRFLHGCYPQRILVDKIYRNREAISWCRAQGIQLTGPALGRPAKNAERTKQAKKQEYQDICDRNIVEGEFGVGKRSYGLNRIMARLQETSFCVIGIALLCMNLAKRLRSLLHHFLQIWFLSAPSPVFTF